MNRWADIDHADIPDHAGQLRLLRRGDEFAIKIKGVQGELMNSRTHGSEDALGAIACASLIEDSKANVLIGGLGMGFTLAAVLKAIHFKARVEVAELVPGVVRWNREVLGGCAGYPLLDGRVEVRVENVRAIINRSDSLFDAIILDVDNGPEGLTHPGNDHLYSLDGLEAISAALRPSGVLAVWSVSPSPRFAARLKQVGFIVQAQRVRAHQGKGARHTIFLATRN